MLFVFIYLSNDFIAEYIFLLYFIPSWNCALSAKHFGDYTPNLVCWLLCVIFHWCHRWIASTVANWILTFCEFFEMVAIIETWASGKSVVSFNWRSCVCVCVWMYDSVRLNHFNNMRHQLWNVEQLQLISHLVHKNLQMKFCIKNRCSKSLLFVWIPLFLFDT